MIRAGLLLVLLLATPARAESFPRPSRFSAPLAADVFGTALSFIAPRSLTPASIPQLTLWGLHGLTTLDPALTPALHDGGLILTERGRTLFSDAKPPAEDDAGAWGDEAARMAAAASLASAAVRRAGTEAVIRSFFDEMFNHLDPYSRYEPPDSAESGRERRSGNAGAGMRVEGRRGRIVVTQVLADSPAADARIMAGDSVLAVDGEPTRGHGPATVDDWIAGPEDTTVVLRLRTRTGQVRTVTIKRALVPPETVFASRTGSRLVLRVTGFSGDTGERIAHELERGLALSPGTVHGVVLDLRGNRGGLLRQAVAAADSVLESGVIASTSGRDPHADHLWRAAPGDLSGGLPIVVEVDGRTASAAEILAASLADQRRAVVVGSSTLGKGLVQAITPLPDGGELFVTWSRVLAPRGWPLQGLGVLPQVCTSKGEEEMQRQLDALAEGRQEMADALARARAARAPLSANEILDIRGACPAAEGGDADTEAARFLLDRPEAYQAALLPETAEQPPPSGGTPLGAAASSKGADAHP